LAPLPEATRASRVRAATGTTVCVFVLFVSSAVMVASAMFFLYMSGFEATRYMLVGAGSFTVAASVYGIALRSLARPGRSRSPALYRTRIVSLWRAPLPPIVCGVAVAFFLITYPILIPIALLGCMKWAHSARRRIADDLCAFRERWNVRRVREVVLLLETLLILGTIPLLGLIFSLLNSLDYGFGGFLS
jgi:hypothetical protein